MAHPAIGREITLLGHGFVRLDDAMASDLSVANSARVSFAKRKEAMEASDEGLIRFLLRERHGTPFEHNAFRFHIRCPLFVAREWMRHRVGSFNEESARYHQLEGDFYLPEPDDVRTQVGEPGWYFLEPRRRNGEAERVRSELFQVACRRAYALYLDLIDRRASQKELRARCVPPDGHVHPVLLDRKRAQPDEFRSRFAPRRQPSSRSGATPRRSRASSAS